MKATLIFSALALLASFDILSQDFSYSDEVLEVKPEKYDKLRFYLGAGAGYRIAPLDGNIPSEFRDYAQKLKLGAFWGMGMGYFFSRTFGAGVEYNNYHASNEVILEVGQPDGSILIGRMADAIRIQFLGPSFDVRYGTSESRWKIISSYSLGYLHYRNDAAYFGKFTLTGQSLGLNLSYSVDYKISDKLVFGAYLGGLLGVFTQFNVNDGFNSYNIYAPAGSGENVSRFDLGLGMRFY